MRFVITSPTLSESRQCKVPGHRGSLRPEKGPRSVMGEFWECFVAWTREDAKAVWMGSVLWVIFSGLLAWLQFWHLKKGNLNSLKAASPAWQRLIYHSKAAQKHTCESWELSDSQDRTSGSVTLPSTPPHTYSHGSHAGPVPRPRSPATALVFWLWRWPGSLTALPGSVLPLSPPQPSVCIPKTTIYTS